MHPIVAQIKPSPEQDPAVCLRDRDVAVTAGAGTGKTLTLVARYLSLVAQGMPLRRIVAITFTRKAAREMRNRVREEIRGYLAGLGLHEGEQQRWQSLYSELDAARIGTIHSLCSEILRAHPAEAGLDPNFGVLEEGQASILLRGVSDQALAWAADHAELVGLFKLLGEKGLRDTVDTMLACRLDVEECLAHRPPPLWPAWEVRLLGPVKEFVGAGEVQAGFAELQAVRDDGTLAQAEAAGDKLAVPLHHLLGLWEEIAACRGWGRPRTGGHTTLGPPSPTCEDCTMPI